MGVTYTIMSSNDEKSIVAFYDNGEDAQEVNYSLYDAYIVDTNTCLQKVDGCWPETPEYTGYTFANWDAYKGGGAPFVETTIVRGDTQVFSQKITVNGENAGTEIHVMNPNHELMRRFIELYNIANDTEYTISNVTGPVKITVYDNEGNLPIPIIM